MLEIPIIHKHLIVSYRSCHKHSHSNDRKEKTTEIYQKPQKVSSQDRRNHASRDSRRTTENVQPNSQDPCQQRLAEFIKISCVHYRNCHRHSHSNDRDKKPQISIKNNRKCPTEIAGAMSAEIRDIHIILMRCFWEFPQA